MRLVLALTLAALVAPALAAPAPSFSDEAKQADVIFLGKLVEVGDAPGFVSGGVMAIQTLTYDVTKVEKGSEKRTRVPVRYLIVGDAPYIFADKTKVGVAPRLTKVGSTYEVLEKDHPDVGRFALDARLVP